MTALREDVPGKNVGRKKTLECGLRKGFSGGHGKSWKNERFVTMR